MHMYTCMLGRTLDLIHHNNNMHLDNIRFLRPRLLLIKEVVSLMYLISVYNPFFDTHLKQCEYWHVFLLNRLSLPLFNSKGRGTG